MEKKNSCGRQHIIFIVFALFFAIYLNNNMIALILGTYEVENMLNFNLLNASIICMFLLGLGYVLMNLNHVDKLYTRKIFIFFIWIMLISFIYSIYIPLESLLLYISIPSNIILFLFFYLYSKQNNNLKVLYWVTFVIFLYLFMNFIKNYSALTLFLGMDEVLINASYILLLLLPILLLIPNSLLKLISLILTSIIIVFSNKRTGTIAFVLSFLCYVIANIFLQHKSLKQTLLFSMLFAIFISFLIYFIYNFDLDFYFSRFESLESDGGSGRDVIWTNVLSMIENSNVNEFIFGHGWNMVLMDSPMKLSAHNDFLEIFYDFGLVGFLLYVNVMIFMFILVFHLIRRKSQYASSAIFSLASILVISFSSHIIIYPYFSYIVLAFWGILLGLIDKSKKCINFLN